MTDFTPPPKLLGQVRDRLRLKHYSMRTETQYVNWIRRFILFHDKRHPVAMGAVEVEAFLTYLAVEGRVAASMQNQVLSVLLFLCREVRCPLNCLGWMGSCGQKHHRRVKGDAMAASLSFLRRTCPMRCLASARWLYPFFWSAS